MVNLRMALHFATLHFRNNLQTRAALKNYFLVKAARHASINQINRLKSIPGFCCGAQSKHLTRREPFLLSPEIFHLVRPQFSGFSIEKGNGTSVRSVIFDQDQVFQALFL